MAAWKSRGSCADVWVGGTEPTNTLFLCSIPFCRYFVCVYIALDTKLAAHLEYMQNDTSKVAPITKIDWVLLYFNAFLI